MEPGIETWFRGPNRDRASLERAINQAGYQYMHFKCHDDRWRGQGEALLHVQKRFLLDSKGGFVQGSYLGASDGYYKHYVDHKGEPNCLPDGTFHHLCLRRAKDCPARTREGFVIHIDEWQWVSPSQVKRLLRDWGYRQLPLLEAEPASTRDQERKGHAPVPHSDSEASESPARLSVEAEAPGERPPALNRRGRRARRTRSKRKPEVQVANALDEVLCTDDLEADPPLRRSKATFLSEGLDKLRQQLGHKDSAQERKRSQDTATALAEKAASAAAKKPPAKKPRTSGLAASLRKALKREETATDEEAGDEGEEADEDSEIFAGLHSRRQKLRTLAKLQPGKLLVAGMQNFAEQLGQAFGEASDDPLRPLAVRYLLSVVAPTYPGQTLSDSDYRELRSLAEMLDQLVRGETATLGDFLMQRFKAKRKAYGNSRCLMECGQVSRADSH